MNALISSPHSNLFLMTLAIQAVLLMVTLCPLKTEEIKMVEEAMHAGIKLLLTMHGNSLEDIPQEVDITYK